MTRDILLPLMAFAAFCAVCELLGWAMHAIRTAPIAVGWPEAGATVVVVLGALLLVIVVAGLVILFPIDRMEA